MQQMAMDRDFDNATNANGSGKTFGEVENQEIVDGRLFQSLPLQWAPRFPKSLSPTMPTMVAQRKPTYQGKKRQMLALKEAEILILIRIRIRTWTLAARSSSCCRCCSLSREYWGGKNINISENTGEDKILIFQRILGRKKIIFLENTATGEKKY